VSESEHPIRIAALAVVGTIGVCSLIVSQWILPAVTASLKYKNELLNEKLSKETNANLETKHKYSELLRAVEDEKQASKKKFARWPAPGLVDTRLS
jgi:hypothetical protein